MHGRKLQEMICNGLTAGNRINLVLNSMLVPLSDNILSMVFFNLETFFQVKFLWFQSCIFSS